MSYQKNLSILKKSLARDGRVLSVSSVLDFSCELHGEKDIFFSLSDDNCNEKNNMSSSNMRNMVNVYSNILKNKYRINRYARVGILIRNSLDYQIWFLAIIRAGGIAVPMNENFEKSELDEYLIQTDVNILVTESCIWGGGVPSRHIEKYISLDDKNIDKRGCFLGHVARGQSNEFDPVMLNSDDVVLIVHTSGTTGIPKPVVHTNSTLVSVMLSNSKALFTSKDERIMAVMPCNHWISHCAFIVTLVSGDLTWWVIKYSKAAFILQKIDEYRITSFIGFAGNYAKMYSEGLDNYCLDYIKMWISVADVSYEIHQREFVKKGALFRVFGTAIVKSLFIDLLGSSETGVPALMRVVSPFSNKFGRYLGRPTSNSLKVNVVDEFGNDVPANHPGRLVVNGPTLFKGYWNDSEKMLGVFHNGWWWTGDIVYRDRFGRFYHMDRAVNLIETSRGPVSSLSIEEQVLKAHGVLSACVLGVKSDDSERSTIACVIHCQKDKHEYAAIVSAIREFGLAKEIDRYFFTLNDFPRGLTGKVLKRKLKESISAGWDRTNNKIIQEIGVF